MTITANLADGRVLNFPDGTDPTVIQNTVRGMISNTQQPAVQDANIIDSDALPVDSLQPVTQELRPEQAATPVEQDFIPTEENLAIPPARQPQTTVGQDITTGLETGAAIVSSAVAEPIAGFAGLITAPFVGIEEAVKNIDSIRDSLTFQPKSEESKAQLQSIGEVLKPIGEAFSQAESLLGDSVLEATGSPSLAAAAHSLPTAVLELIGVKGLKSTKLKDVKLSSNIAEAIQQSAPDIKAIKSATTAAYKELDDLGVKIKPEVYDRFVDNLQAKLNKQGLDKDLTPKATTALDRLIESKGTAKTAGEIEVLRKKAQIAAKSIESSDARLGSMIIEDIDLALDKLSNEIGGKFKQARGLAQRAFKSQTITDMIENASHTASGMENGLRIEARKILKNKKKRRGFTSDELSALRKIEQGTKSANVAKFLGKFGISEQQATSMLGASIGIGGGGAIGAMFGPGGAAIGALTVPALGQLAKKTAQRITLKNTKLADDLVRAGKNANEVTKAYLKHTPISDRSISDLTDLLLDPNLRGVDVIKSTSNKTVSDAIFFAKEIKRRMKQSASAATIAAPATLEEQQ
jgi:hypothetical protein